MNEQKKEIQEIVKGVGDYVITSAYVIFSNELELANGFPSVDLIDKHAYFILGAVVGITEMASIIEGIDDKESLKPSVITGLRSSLRKLKSPNNDPETDLFINSCSESLDDLASINFDSGIIDE